jgi:hypothetical protein
MNVAKGLTLKDTYVLQEVSSGIECNDPLTESRDYSKEVSDQVTFLHALPSQQPLDEKKADIWWKGTTPTNKYLSTRKHSNGVDCFDIAVDGSEALVFTQENNNGKLVRYWLNKDTNLTARIRYVNTPSHPASWRLEVYRNERRDGKWHGARLVEHYVHRTITNESELTVAKFVAVYFARFSS